MNLTPDGIAYWRMGNGEAACQPYRLRWLLPMILRTNYRAWNVTNVCLLWGIAILLFIYTGSVLTALIPAVYPIFRFWKSKPVLTDVFGIFMAMTGAVVFTTLSPLAGVIITSIGALGNEKTPLFAALYAWHPALLIGLLPVGISHILAPSADVQTTFQDKPQLAEVMERVISEPLKTAWEVHRPTLARGSKWLLPWGGLLIPLFFVPATPQLLLTVAAAYSLCLMATDSVRLYTWALPVVALSFAAMPYQAQVLALLASWFLLPYNTKDI